VMSSRFFMSPSSADGAPLSVRPAPVTTRACMWIERTHQPRAASVTCASGARSRHTSGLPRRWKARRAKRSERAARSSRKSPGTSRQGATYRSPQRLLAISTEMQPRTQPRRAGQTTLHRPRRPVRNHARARDESMPQRRTRRRGQRQQAVSVSCASLAEPIARTGRPTRRRRHEVTTKPSSSISRTTATAPRANASRSSPSSPSVFAAASIAATRERVASRNGTSAAVL
jgi:hypothetical protein